MRDLRDDPAYRAETELYLQHIEEVFRWKERLDSIMRNYPDLSLHPECLRSLFYFLDADEVPLDTGQDLLEAAARNLEQEASTVMAMVKLESIHPLLKLLQFVFPPSGIANDDKDPARLSWYQRLTGELVNAGFMSDDVRNIIDDPGNVPQLKLYPQAIIETVQRVLRSRDEKPSESDLKFMAKLHQNYPASSGIAFHYAVMLLNSGNYEAGKKVLQAGASAGFHDSGREHCQEVLKQLLGQ